MQKKGGIEMITCITPEGVMIEVGLEAWLRRLTDGNNNEIGEISRNNSFFLRKEVSLMSGPHGDNQAACEQENCGTDHGDNQQ